MKYVFTNKCSPNTRFKCVFIHVYTYMKIYIEI